MNICFNILFIIKFIFCFNRFYNIHIKKYPITEHDRESIKVNIKKSLKGKELQFKDTLFGFQVKMNISDKLTIEKSDTCNFTIEEDYPTAITDYKIHETEYINLKPKKTKREFVDNNIFNGKTTSENKLKSILCIIEKENKIANQFGAPENLTFLSKSLNSKTTNKYRFPSDAGSNNVDIYVLDTGINIKHPEFEPNTNRVLMINNFTDEHSLEDFNGHGTHVSGIIGGLTYGVAKKAKINGIKVLNSEGKGSNSSLINGLYYVLDEHIKKSEQIENINTKEMMKDIEMSINSTLKNENYISKVSKKEIINDITKTLNKHIKKVYSVVNISLGGPVSKIISDVLELLNKHNIFVVVAAGNDDSNACKYSPANSINVITVGALNKTNDGPAKFTNKGKCVDIFAPGTNIRSSYYENDHNSYKSLSGTSMAAPHVTGVVALYLSKLSNGNDDVMEYIFKHKDTDLITPNELKELLLNHARKIENINSGFFSITNNELNVISIRQLLKSIRRREQ